MSEQDEHGPSGPPRSEPAPARPELATDDTEPAPPSTRTLAPLPPDPELEPTAESDEPSDPEPSLALDLSGPVQPLLDPEPSAALELDAPHAIAVEPELVASVPSSARALVESSPRAPERASPPTPTPWRVRAPEPGAPSYVMRAPTATLVQMIKPNAAVILLGAVFLLSVIEMIAAFLVYRETLSPDDWLDIAAHVDAQEPAPVFVASDWLAPRARMELPHARSWDSLAPPDLRGVPSFWVIGYGRDVWSRSLHAELEGLPMPDLVALHSFGALMLAEYRQADPGERAWSLLERELAISSDAGRCTGKRESWACKDGRVHARVVEVDYRPRRCLAIALDEGSSATIELGKLELGNRLRGHVGFADFNSRLRADPTLVLEAEIDGEVAARWLFTDDQGWAAFALATEPGKHRVTLRVATTSRGTWQREGHRPSPDDLPCIEARAFVETEPPPEEAPPEEVAP